MNDFNDAERNILFDLSMTSFFFFLVLLFILVITFKGNRDEVTFDLASDILFDKLSAELKDDGIEILNARGDSILHYIHLKTKDGELNLDKISVEGHADRRPLGKSWQFPSDWELSSARASSVVRFLYDSKLKYKGLNFTDLIKSGKVSASGYSYFRPKAIPLILNKNLSENELYKDRRIEIKLVFKPAYIEHTTK